MGFFDFLFGGSEESQLKRHSKRLNNLNAQFEDRMASAQWLADQGSQEAIVALLKRFSLTYEQRMKDADEKNMVYQLLEEIGSDVLEPTKNWIRKNANFAIPLQLIDKFEGDESTITLLLELLGLEIDPFKSEKKRQILIHLSKYKDARIIERVPACLEDFDEGVRYAAVEALAFQNDDSVREDLATAIANPEEESNRLRVRIAEIFHNRKWSLGEKSSFVQNSPPTGYIVQEDQILPDPNSRR